MPPRRGPGGGGGQASGLHWHQWDYTGQAVRIAPIDPPLGAVEPWALTKVAGDKLPGSASPAPLSVEVLNQPFVIAVVCGWGSIADWFWPEVGINRGIGHGTCKQDLQVVK